MNHDFGFIAFPLRVQAAGDEIDPSSLPSGAIEFDDLEILFRPDYSEPLVSLALLLGVMIADLTIAKKRRRSSQEESTCQTWSDAPAA